MFYNHLMWLRKGHQVAGVLYTISPMKQLCLLTIYSVASRERHVEREVYLESLSNDAPVLLKTDCEQCQTPVPACQPAIANACRI
jgi:hypothetical protein